MTDQSQKDTEAIYTSHHDTSRKGVGRTAHVVAMVRHLETLKGEDRRLINDPFAEQLAGETGKSYVKGYSKFFYFLIGSQFLRNIFWLLSPVLNRIPELGMLDGIPIRTKNIDDTIKWNVKTNEIRQICVLGAGLDSRPWRLKFSDIFEQSTNPEEGTIEAFPKVSYFELDFPELFNYKLPIISSTGASSDFEYVKVEADLSLPDWTEKLLATGFQRDLPTLWILEGFTGYLTEDEFRSLFGTISERLSAKGSRFIGNFVKPQAEQIDVAKGMHKFRPRNPTGLVESFGWINVKEESFDEAGKRFSREIYPIGSVKGHVFITAEKA